MKNGEEKAARKSAERKGSGGNDRVATKTRGKGKKAAKIAAVTFAVLFAACGIVMLGGFLWFRSWAEGVELDPSLLPTATAIPVVLDRNGNDMGYATDDYVAPGLPPQTRGSGFCRSRRQAVLFPSRLRPERHTARRFQQYQGGTHRGRRLPPSRSSWSKTHI